MWNTDNPLKVSFCYRMIGNDGFSQRTRETSLDLQSCLTQAYTSNVTQREVIFTHLNDQINTWLQNMTNSAKIGIRKYLAAAFLTK